VANSEQLGTQIAQELGFLGISSSDKQRDLLLKHLLLMLEKNSQINLTSVTDECDAITLHVVDSCLVAHVVKKYLVETSDVITHLETSDVITHRFLDIGTGGGFPGIPFGIMTGWDGVLIDSVGKKVTAVNEFINTLGLPLQLKADSVRAEQLALNEAQSFGCVIARGVGRMGMLIEYATPFLCDSGVFIASKANINDDEREQAEKIAEICGLECVSCETFELPRDMGHRELDIYKKVEESRVKLPRAIGRAKKRPLT